MMQMRQGRGREEMRDEVVLVFGGVSGRIELGGGAGTDLLFGGLLGCEQAIGMTQWRCVGVSR